MTTTCRAVYDWHLRKYEASFECCDSGGNQPPRRMPSCPTGTVELYAAGDGAVLAGKLDARDYMANRDDYLAVEWHTPKWAWVDPEKDVKAEIMAIRAGLKARSMSINETGLDEEEVDEQIARDNERADRLGLVLDSDPRKTDARGQAANILDTGDGGDAPDGGAPADSTPEPPKPKPPKPKRKEPKK